MYQATAQQSLLSYTSGLRRNLEHFSPPWLMIRSSTMWRLAAMTGMRRGEVLGLRWQDIDMGAGRLSIRQTVTPIKGVAVIGRAETDRSQRTIDLDDDTVAALESHRARQAQEKLILGSRYQDTDLVFACSDGTCLSPAGITEWFERRVARSRQPMIRLHDLRHTHASNLLGAGGATHHCPRGRSRHSGPQRRRRATPSPDAGYDKGLPALGQ